jgi:GNAT superfamily N-acetyltransferase
MNVDWATSEDRDILLEIVSEFLEEAALFYASELAPTHRNAKNLVDLVLIPAAAQRYPVLLARDSGAVVGGLWWTPPTPQFDYKVRFAFGATFVRKPHRRRGIGRMLRRIATERLRELGVEEVRGIVDNRNKASLRAMGSLPHSMVVGSYRIYPIP